MNQAQEREQHGPLVLTASNDAAEEARLHGVRAESLFAFKHRLGHALHAPNPAAAAAERFLRACVLTTEPVGSVGTEWSPRAKIATILRELSALDDPERESAPAIGYAEIVRATLRAKLGDHGRRDLARLVRSARPEQIESIVGAGILVRGIYRFAPDDLALFGALQWALAKSGYEVCVEIPGSSQQRLDFTRTDPFGPLEDTVAKALQAPPTFVEASAALGNAELAEEEGRIACVTVRDEWGAAEAATRHLRAHFRSGKVSLTDIALVVNDLDSSVLSPLLATLADARIPAIDPRGFELETAEVIWAAGRLAELAVASTPRDLAELFASPAIDIGLDIHARNALQARLRASASVKIPNLEALYAQETDTLGEDQATRLALATRAVCLATSRGTAVTALSSLWSAFGLPRAADRGATATLRKDDAPDAIELRELHVVAREGAYMRALMDAIGAYRATLLRIGALESQADAVQVAREIFSLLPRRLPPLPAARAGMLKIVTFAETSGIAARYAIVVDAANDANDTTRSKATARGRAWEFTAELWGLVHACRRVTFIIPTFLGGAATTPWEELAAAKRSASETTQRRTDGGAAYSEIAERMAVEAERERYFLSPTRVSTPTIGQLPNHALLGAYVSTHRDGAAARSMPVTTLESFATCAFRGFAEHILFARDKQAEGLTLAARDEGALLHDFCAEAFEQTRDLWALRPRPAGQILDALESIVQRHMLDAPIGSIRRVELGYARILARQVLLTSILEEEWDYVLAEQAFGTQDPSSWPALPLPGASATLSGRIDRVDVSRDRKSYRVIDYKRGKQDDKLVGMTALQLPLYARVVEEKTHLPVVEGTYWRLVGKGTGRKAVASKTWNAARDEALERAEATFRRTREGNIEPRPYLPSTCQMCAVSGVCRRPPFAIPELAGDG